MEQDLASGQFLTASYTIDGVSKTFRSFDEWHKYYGFVCSRAAAESSTTPRGRTYGRPSGRFSS
jgi:hypothetical protein